LGEKFGEGEAAAGVFGGVGFGEVPAAAVVAAGVVFAADNAIISYSRANFWQQNEISSH